MLSLSELQLWKDWVVTSRALSQMEVLSMLPACPPSYQGTQRCTALDGAVLLAFEPPELRATLTFLPQKPCHSV